MRGPWSQIPTVMGIKSSTLYGVVFKLSIPSTVSDQTSCCFVLLNVTQSLEKLTLGRRRFRDNKVTSHC